MAPLVPRSYITGTTLDVTGVLIAVFVAFIIVVSVWSSHRRKRRLREGREERRAAVAAAGAGIGTSSYHHRPAAAYPYPSPLTHSPLSSMPSTHTNPNPNPVVYTTLASPTVANVSIFVHRQQQQQSPEISYGASPSANPLRMGGPLRRRDTDGDPDLPAYAPPPYEQPLPKRPDRVYVA